jgi:hypothetical protein
MSFDTCNDVSFLHKPEKMTARLYGLLSSTYVFDIVSLYCNIIRPSVFYLCIMITMVSVNLTGCQVFVACSAFLSWHF